MTSTEAFYRTRWAKFHELQSTIDHWYWRPGWRLGRRFYTWHLTFPTDSPVRTLAAFYQDRISLPFLDRVPLDGLHLTIQGIGFTDEVSRKHIDRIVATSRNHLRNVPAFALTLGPADADAQGVPLAVRPLEPIQQIRAALREAIADVWGTHRVPEPAEGFHPHVTVFYSNAPADPAPLRDRLQELRSTSPVSTQITEVSLIELSRDRKIYEWNTIATVNLGTR